MVISDDDDDSSNFFEEIQQPTTHANITTNHNNNINKNEHSKPNNNNDIRKKKSVKIKGRRVQRRSKIIRFDDDDDDVLGEYENDKKAKKREDLNKLFGFKSAIQNKLLNTGKILTHWNDNNKLDINLIGRTNTIINQIANTSYDVIFSPENITSIESFDNWNAEFDDGTKTVLSDKLDVAKSKEDKDITQPPQSVESFENVKDDFDCVQKLNSDKLTAQQIVDKSFAVNKSDIVSSFNSWFSDIRSATKVAASTTLTHTVKAFAQNAQNLLKPTLTLNSIIDETTNERCLQQEIFNQDQVIGDSMPYKNNIVSTQVDGWGDEWDDEVIQLKFEDVSTPSIKVGANKLIKGLNDLSDNPIVNISGDNQTESRDYYQSSIKSSLNFQLNVVPDKHQSNATEIDLISSKLIDFAKANENSKQDDWDVQWEDQEIDLDLEETETNENKVQLSNIDIATSKPDCDSKCEVHEVVLDEFKNFKTKISVTENYSPQSNIATLSEDQIIDTAPADWNVQLGGQEIVDNELEPIETKIPTLESSVIDSTDVVEREQDVEQTAWEDQKIVVDQLECSSTDISTPVNSLLQLANVNVSNKNQVFDVEPVNVDFSKPNKVHTDWDAQWSDQEIVSDELELIETKIQSSENQIALSVDIHLSTYKNETGHTDWETKWDDQEITETKISTLETSVVETINADVVEREQDVEQTAWEDQEIVVDQLEPIETKIPTLESSVIDSTDVVEREQDVEQTAWEDQEIVVDQLGPIETKIPTLESSVIDSTDVVEREQDVEQTAWEDQEIVVDQLEPIETKIPTLESSVIDSTDVVEREQDVEQTAWEDQEIVVDQLEPIETKIPTLESSVIDSTDVVEREQDVEQTAWEDQEIVVDQLECSSTDISTPVNNLLLSTNVNVSNKNQVFDVEPVNVDFSKPNKDHTDWDAQWSDQEIVSDELEPIETKIQSSKNQIALSVDIDVAANKPDALSTDWDVQWEDQEIELEEVKINASENAQSSIIEVLVYSDYEKNSVTEKQDLRHSGRDVQLEKQEVVVDELKLTQVQTNANETIKKDFLESTNLDILSSKPFPESNEWDVQWEDQEIVFNEIETNETQTLESNLSSSVSNVGQNIDETQSNSTKCNLPQSVDMNISTKNNKVSDTFNSEWNIQQEDEQIVVDKTYNQTIESDLIRSENVNILSNNQDAEQNSDWDAQWEYQEIILSNVEKDVTETQTVKTDNLLQTSNTDIPNQTNDQEIVLGELDGKEIQTKVNDINTKVLADSDWNTQWKDNKIDETNEVNNLTIQSDLTHSVNVGVSTKNEEALDNSDWNAQWEDHEIILCDIENDDITETQTKKENNLLQPSKTDVLIDMICDEPNQTKDNSADSQLVYSANIDVQSDSKPFVEETYWEDREVVVEENDNNEIHSIKDDLPQFTNTDDSTNKQDVLQSDNEIEIEDAVPTSSYNTRMEKFFVYNSGMMYFNKNLSEHQYPNHMLETKLDLRNLERPQRMKISTNDEIEELDTQDDNFEPNLDQDDNNELFNLTGSVEELCDQVLEEMNNDNFNEDLLIRRVSDEWCDNLMDHKDNVYWEDYTNQTSNTDEYCSNNETANDNDKDPKQHLSNDSFSEFNQTNSPTDYFCGQLDNYSYFNESNQNQEINLNGTEKIQEYSNDLTDLTQLMDDYSLTINNEQDQPITMVETVDQSSEIQDVKMPEYVASKDVSSFKMNSLPLSSCSSTNTITELTNISLNCDNVNTTNSQFTNSFKESVNLDSAEISQPDSDQLINKDEIELSDKVPNNVANIQNQQLTLDENDKFLNEGWDDWDDNDEPNLNIKCEPNNFLVNSSYENSNDLSVLKSDIFDKDLIPLVDKSLEINKTELKEIDSTIKNIDDKMQENSTKLGTDSHLIVEKIDQRLENSEPFLSTVVQDEVKDKQLKEISNQFAEIQITNKPFQSSVIKLNSIKPATYETKTANVSTDKWDTNWDDFDASQTSFQTKSESVARKDKNTVVNNEWTTIWEDTSTQIGSKNKETSKTNLEDWTTDWDDPEPVILKSHDRKNSTITNISVDSDWSADWEVKSTNVRNNSSMDKPFKEPFNSGTKVKSNISNVSLPDWRSQSDQNLPKPYDHQQTTLPDNSQTGSGSWFSDFRSATRSAAVTTVTHAVKNWSFNPTNLLDSVVDNLGSVVGIPSAEEMALAMRQRDQKQNSQHKKTNIETPSEFAHSKKK